MQVIRTLKLWSRKILRSLRFETLLFTLENASSREPRDNVTNSRGCPKMDINVKKFDSFTIIELITVISILIALVGFISFMVKGLIMKGKAARIELDIRSIKMGIYSYWADTGKFPSEEVNNEAFQRLLEDPGILGWQGPYLDTMTRAGPSGITYAIRCDSGVIGCFQSNERAYEQVIYVFEITPTALINLIDEHLDDGNLYSGRVTWVQDHLEIGVERK